MQKLDVSFIDSVKFDSNGLVPVIVQDVSNNNVLMLAYMSKETLRMSIETGKATYWSRSRQKIWVKGETSGHLQYIKELYYDCDCDTILIKVEQVGGKACHTGNYTCFYRGGVL